ncbi:MAG TPA: M1 family aminopeptidase [Gemmatimonadales bacterium]
MKLHGILRYEVAGQLRRPWPWLAFGVLLVFAFSNARSGFVPVTLPQDFILNSPFVITSITVISCSIWLLVAPAIAGEAGARDVHTGMHPLVYTSPISRFEYIGGRYLAAFLLNAFVLLAVQAGSLLAVLVPGVAPEIVGPLRIDAYLRAYLFIALPNAAIATSLQFTLALLSGRAMASYLASVILLVLAYPVAVILYFPLGQPGLARLADPIGVIAIMNEMMLRWTLVEKNVRAFTLEGPILWNRLLWLATALAVLAVLHRSFRFSHRTAAALPFARLWRRADGPAGTSAGARPSDSGPGGRSIEVPEVEPAFGPGIRLRQAAAIASASFGTMAKNPAGLFLLVAFPMFLVLVLLVELEHWSVPLVPRTGYILSRYLTGDLLRPDNYWMIVPLLIVYLVGELVWRERDARVDEALDTTSVPAWVPFLGKFAGLALLLALVMLLVMAAGILVQVIRGHHEHQPGLFVAVLFGLQLPTWLLFAALVFLIQVVVNQKHVALIVTFIVYLGLILAPLLGIEHNLLVYGGGPAWSWTDIRGFGASLAPWLWFKLYWAAWALLLLAGTGLLWVRGRERGVGARLRLARGRLTGAAAGVALTAIGLIAVLGGIVYYNTNVRNVYRSAADRLEQAARYERRYGRFDDIPQPRVTATSVRVEIHPERGAASFTGSYRLRNDHPVSIDSVHIEEAPGMRTRVSFDRPAREVLADGELRHSIHRLDTPLAPGDSLTLRFDVAYERRGFTNGGAGSAVVPNGSYFTDGALPVIGYQAARELTGADDRRAHGLPRQVTFPAPDDVHPDVEPGGGTAFEAIVGTDIDQVAVAPGELRRTWIEGGRRYFHYASDIPITGSSLFFSADYAVERDRWSDVDVSVFHHPAHAANVDRLLRGARAAMEYFSAEFGPYPYRFLQLIEQPSSGLGMGVDGSGVVTVLEGALLLAPEGDGLDVVGEIIAHEIAHQWWGVQLRHAYAEGAIVLSESLAWYSAMQVIRNEKGAEALRRFMSFMRQPNPWPQIRTGLPLLRAMDPYAGYRKGPFALFALGEYIGVDRVNAALATLLRKHAAGSAPPATTLDLYRELAAATPDSLKPLLHDLFEVNAFWTFDTREIAAEPIGGGAWRVTLQVEARKVVADSAGRETEVPITEPVDIGVFAAAPPGEVLGSPLYLRKHALIGGRQTITVTVTGRPAHAGIDPYGLLDWEEGDNIERIELE